ncbi:MAG: hypothetical protein ACI9MR_004555, partial [Myxococcota bacterium]
MSCIQATGALAEPTASYPFDYLDKACLSATNRERGGSGAPVWEFEVDGDVDPDTLRAALTKTFACYPTSRSRMVPDGVYPKVKKLSYEPVEGFDVDSVFKVVDLEPGNEQALVEFRQGVWDNYLDVFEGTPVALTLVRRAPGRAHLFFQQHHSVADGRAFIGWLTDLTAFLAEPSRPVAIVPRVGEAEILKLSGFKKAWWRLLGTLHVAGAIIGGLFRPIKPMLHNQSNDFSGFNRVTCVRFDDQVIPSWKAAAKAEQVSLNSLLTATLMTTMSKWSADHGVPPGKTNCIIASETRPRDGSVVSFANHLTGFLVTFRMDHPHEIGALARRIHAAVKKQAKKSLHIKKLLAERGVVLGMSMHKMLKLVWESRQPAINISFSNLIPLEFPTVEGPGWTAKRLRICTPGLPWGGVGPTVVRYGGE